MQCAFPFHFNRMLYLDSNIPSQIFYASIESENLRIARTATTKELINVVTRVNSLLIRMKNQGSEHILTISLLKKVFRKHFKIIHKFTVQLMNLSSSFLCNYFYLCVYVYFMCIVCAYVCFMCVIYVCMCICCNIFMFISGN